MWITHGSCLTEVHTLLSKQCRQYNMRTILLLLAVPRGLNYHPVFLKSNIAHYLHLPLINKHSSLKLPSSSDNQPPKTMV